MVPVSGFFEYGVAALLGVAVMMFLGVWSLVSEGNARSDESAAGQDEEPVIPICSLYKKAA